MKKIFFVFLFSILITSCFAQQTGQLMRGRSPSGQYPYIAVDEDGKLQTSGSGGGSVNNLASDSAGNLKTNIASWTAGALTLELASSSLNMVQYGIMKENIRQIATDTPFSVSDITSGTVAPFWLTLRNVGVKTIHYSDGTPTDNSDGLVSGEQIAIFCGTNTVNLKLKANSTGISTLTSNIWK